MPIQIENPWRSGMVNCLSPLNAFVSIVRMPWAPKYGPPKAAHKAPFLPSAVNDDHRLPLPFLFRESLQPDGLKTKAESAMIASSSHIDRTYTIWQMPRAF
jgi:hypothetical protein